MNHNLPRADKETVESFTGWEEVIRESVRLPYLDAATVWHDNTGAPLSMTLIFRPPSSTNMHRWTHWYLVDFDANTAKAFRDQASMYKEVKPSQGVALMYWFYENAWVQIARTPYAFNIERDRTTRKWVNHASAR